MVICSAALLVRERAIELGGFDPALPVCEDLDLILRAVRAFGYAGVARPVVEYRVAGPKLSDAAPGDPRFVEAYRRMHARYAADRGRLELLALRSASFLRRWLGR